MDHRPLILGPKPQCAGNRLFGSAPVSLVGLQELRSVHGGTGAHAGPLKTNGDMCLGSGGLPLGAQHGPLKTIEDLCLGFGGLLLGAQHLPVMDGGWCENRACLGFRV